MQRNDGIVVTAFDPEDVFSTNSTKSELTWSIGGKAFLNSEITAIVEDTYFRMVYIAANFGKVPSTIIK
eukprot:gene25403-1685_t